MQPSEKLVKELEAKRSAWNREQNKRAELKEIETAQETVKAKVMAQCARARALAEKHATLSGSHTYLGSDALGRDYQSDWAGIIDESDTSSMRIQARLNRFYGINRGDGAPNLATTILGK